MVYPLIDNSKKLQVVILYGKLNSGGYASGAAAGRSLDFAFQRAYSELLRHFVAVVNLDKSETSKYSYINRLEFMGNQENSKLLSSRINEIGTRQIILPKLIIDCEIGSEKFDKIIYTHKCHFENQPVFIDSDPTVFCI